MIFEGSDVLLDFAPTMLPNYRYTGTIAVTAIASYGIGMVVGLSTGHVILYDKNDDAKSLYTPSQIYITTPNVPVTHVTLGSVEDIAICMLQDAGTFEISLIGESFLESETQASSLLHRVHSGAIIGMDVCIRKPMFVTIGVDKSARVWNYVEGTVDAVAHFEEEPLCVALHPSGHYMLIGFPDYVRLYNVLYDDIRLHWENPCVSCREIKFSHGGQFFAMSTASTIEIRSCWTFDVLMTLLGHEGRILSVAWSVDDSKLISTATDGAIYEWNVLVSMKYTGKSHRNVIVSPNDEVFYSCIEYAPDDSSVYATANDMTFKEFSKSGGVIRDAPTKVNLTQVQLSRSGRMLFSSTKNGAVRALKFPLPMPKRNIITCDDTSDSSSISTTQKDQHQGLSNQLSPSANSIPTSASSLTAPPPHKQPQVITARQELDHQDYPSHSYGISKIRSSHDDAHLFSAGHDGSIIVWKVVDRTYLPPMMKIKELKEALAKQRDNDKNTFNYGDEIMVTKSDLKKMAKTTAALKQQVEDIRKANEAKLQARDKAQQEKLRDLTEKFDAEFKSLREHYDSLEKERMHNQNTFELNLHKIRTDAMVTKADVNKSFQKRMSLELEKQDELTTTLREEKAAWEKQINDDNVEHAKKMDFIKERNEARIAEKNAEAARLRAEISKCKDLYNQSISDLTSTSSDEVTQIQVQYEEKLALERESLVSIVSDNEQLKTTFSRLNSELTSCRAELAALVIEDKKLHDRLKRLEREFEVNKKEMEERDTMMIEKDARVVDLKNKNRELEKFKFVLELKIQEMKKQIEPKDANVVDLSLRIEQMQAELSTYTSHNQSLLRELDQVKAKVHAVCQVRDDAKARVQRCLDAASRIREQVSHVYRLSRRKNGESVDVHALKSSFTSLLHKYNPPLHSTGPPRSASTTPLQHLLRHRDLLEKGCDTLRRNMNVRMDSIEAEELKYRKENLLLLSELNDLRRDCGGVAERLIKLGDAERGDRRKKRERLPPLA
ncbi:hypothetical protein SeMB42_g01437 [Synchytrium endobioticum]|nr:hypothetical protein SeMB42_g01437 [Synchytrium endobioticum]